MKIDIKPGMRTFGECVELQIYNFKNQFIPQPKIKVIFIVVRFTTFTFCTEIACHTLLRNWSHCYGINFTSSIVKFVGLQNNTL